MRLMLVAALLSAGFGCKLADTIDEACPDKVAGATEGVHAVGLDIMLRVQCHRRFVGLSAGKITASAQLAAASHAVYLEENNLVGTASGEDLVEEEAGLPGFTGESVQDRFVASGAIMSGTKVGAWDILHADVTRDVDDWFRDPYLRDALFQPGWIGGGISVVTNPTNDSLAAYLNVLYYMPSTKQVAQPIVYPRDGQVDVPLSFVTSGARGDPVSIDATVGFPITITVGSATGEGPDNPYQLRVLSALLTDLDNDVIVETITIEPTALDYAPLLTTAIVVPVDPLATGHTYAFEAEIEWNMGKKTVKSEFRAGDASLQ